MKNVIFTDDIITCECGFKGNLKQMTKHFEKTWDYVSREDSVDLHNSPGINKNGHVRAGTL